MTRYSVIVWCHDCTGVDPQGCFDGGSEEVFADAQGTKGYSWTNKGIPITTREMAEEVGWAATHDCAPWDFDIKEVPDDQT